MVALGGADVAQYFGFAINLAQRLAYLFGEDDLFTGGSSDMPEEAKMRIIAYLGVMFGAAGAAQLVAKTGPRTISCTSRPGPTRRSRAGGGSPRASSSRGTRRPGPSGTT